MVVSVLHIIEVVAEEEVEKRVEGGEAVVATAVVGARRLKLPTALLPRECQHLYDALGTTPVCPVALMRLDCVCNKSADSECECLGKVVVRMRSLPGPKVSVVVQ